MTGSSETLPQILLGDILESLRLAEFSDHLLPIYRFGGAIDQGINFLCALVPSGSLSEVLSEHSWSVQIDSATPQFVGEKVNEEWEYTLQGHSRCPGAIPLVWYQSFHDIRPPEFGIAEGLRLTFNLYNDRANKRWLRILDDGELAEVGHYSDTAIYMRRSLIREYAAMLNCHVLVQYDYVRSSSSTLEELGLQEFGEKESSESFVLHRGVRGTSLGEGRSCWGYVLGKTVIPPDPRESTSMWPYKGVESEEDYPEFLIGFDSDGNEQSFTCDPAKLANAFGSNPGAPSYLTPVFFDRAVLRKYLADDKYKVGDGQIQCGGLWNLRLDNNHPDYVMVFLGDLGTYLPRRVRDYWRPFNVAVKSGMSRTAFRRSMLGQWADPESPDHRVRQMWSRVQRAWDENVGWPILMPLGDEEAHVLESLTVPVTDGQVDFEDVVIRLSKLVVESVNQKAIRSTGVEAERCGSINLLEAYLNDRGMVGFEDSIKFLRDLQDLRSGVGHRKGTKYMRAVRGLHVESQGRRKTAVMLMDAVASVLENLELMATKEAQYQLRSEKET